MARKTETITIESENQENRDRGKAFLLTEMPATQAEKWASRAFAGMSKSGVNIPDNFKDLGAAAIGILGLKAFGSMDWGEMEPLLDEMFECVQFIPDPTRPQIIRPLIEDDIEEVGTRFLLRRHIFELHLGFIRAAARSTSGLAASPSPSPA